MTIALDQTGQRRGVTPPQTGQFIRFRQREILVDGSFVNHTRIPVYEDAPKKDASQQGHARPAAPQ